ncbi:MAG TPA: hypothetical protein VL576_01655 [Candidatus Paceibacterota bacterium]|jgi:hypothetical protein|nr:hypothetical protein [Candidatus Paceibacterota bacterium]
MNEEHEKPINERPLTPEEVHEENKRREHEARQHQNKNPNLGKPVNPTHHGADNR